MTTDPVWVDVVIRGSRVSPRITAWVNPGRGGVVCDFQQPASAWALSFSAPVSTVERDHERTR
jgi:hypothetical protein